MEDNVGTDVLVMMQGHQIVNLGRSDRYTVNGRLPKEDDLDSLHLEEISRVKSELQALAAYTPKNLEELKGLKDTVDELVDDLSEVMLKIGRQSVLVNILSDNELTCKFE